MLDGKPKPPEELLAALPFALATRVLRSLPEPATWKDFASHPDIVAFAEMESMLGETAFRANFVQDWAATSIVNLWHFALHEKTGLRVYELTTGLAQKLYHTEVRGLSTDDLRLPYQSIYIVMPPPTERMNLKLSNELTGAHDLGGVYVAETTHNNVRVWKMLFWGPPNEKSKSEYDDALFHFTVKLPEGMDLADALDLNEKETANNAATSHSARFYQEFWRPLFKLVMNVVVYLTWPDADVRQVENSQYTKLHEKLKKHPKGSNKYERARQELREVPQQRRILLGASVRHLPAEGPSDPGSPLTVRTLVTGHWQRFAYGPGRTERRWGWREPFWRGPANGVESNPRRVLGTKEAT